MYSNAAPGGRLYKKGQKGWGIRWSNDNYLISIGRPPNPPGSTSISSGGNEIAQKFKKNEHRVLRWVLTLEISNSEKKPCF